MRLFSNKKQQQQSRLSYVNTDKHNKNKEKANNRWK